MSDLPPLQVIQGTADVSAKLTQAEFSTALGFVVGAFDRKGQADGKDEKDPRIFEEIRRTQTQNMDNIQSFTMDVIDGRLPRLSRGNLGLDSVLAPSKDLVVASSGDTRHCAVAKVSCNA